MPNFKDFYSAAGNIVYKLVGQLACKSSVVGKFISLYSTAGFIHAGC